MKKIVGFGVHSLEGTRHLNEDRWTAYMYGKRIKRDSLTKQDNEEDSNNNDDDSSSTTSSGIHKHESTNKKKEKKDKPNVIKPSFFAIYDGHGGGLCADFIARTLHSRIINKSTSRLFFVKRGTPVDEKGIIEAILNGFAKTEEEVTELTKSRADFSGSCAIVVIVVGKKLFVANLGDCRAILGRRSSGPCLPIPQVGGRSSNNNNSTQMVEDGSDGSGGGEEEQQTTIKTKAKNTTIGRIFNTTSSPSMPNFRAIALSEDHKASSPGEKKRITKAGGWVYDSRVWGTLAVARSFGDRGLKGYTNFLFLEEGLAASLAVDEEEDEEEEEEEDDENGDDNDGSGTSSVTKDDSSPKSQRKKRKQHQHRRRQRRRHIKADDSENESGDHKEDDNNNNNNNDENSNDSEDDSTTNTAKKNRKKSTTTHKRSKSESKLKSNEIQQHDQDDNEQQEEEEEEEDGSQIDNGNDNDDDDDVPLSKADEKKSKKQSKLAKEQDRWKAWREKERKEYEKRLQKQREKRAKKRAELIRKKGGTKVGSVIAVPEIKVYELNNKDDFLFLASDGLWDVISSKRAALLAGKHLWSQSTYAQWGLEQGTLDEVCSGLCNEARRRGSEDDITSLVVAFSDDNSGGADEKKIEK